nr:hypothetical protein StreXyl84_15280 [Streptomyces sp. Xyl84]
MPPRWRGSRGHAGDRVAIGTDGVGTLVHTVTAAPVPDRAARPRNPAALPAGLRRVVLSHPAPGAPAAPTAIALYERLGFKTRAQVTFRGFGTPLTQPAPAVRPDGPPPVRAPLVRTASPVPVPA